jgi:hypothetical protein
MNIKCPGNLHRYFIASFFSLFFISGVSAHGELIWNDFTIDNKNDSIAAAIGQVRKEVADIILGRREARDWPDRELSRLKDELAHYLEEHEALLNYFKEQKVNLNSSRQLMDNPRAGRSMVASFAMETTIALIDYIASLDDPAAFEEDLHIGGKGAYMFDLMDSYTDTMDLYVELAKINLDSNSNNN